MSSEYGVGALTNAVAKKGTASQIILCVIAVFLWIVVQQLYSGIPSEVISAESNTVDYLSLGILLLPVIVAVLFAGLTTWKAMSLIIPLLRAESETSQLLPETFGGKLVIDGNISIGQLKSGKAEKRIKQIMEALVKRVKSVVEPDDANAVRANIFVMKDDSWLTLDNRFLVNMNEQSEKAIKIRNGFYSSGSCFFYAQPIFCDFTDGSEWDHPPTVEIVKRYICNTYGKELVNQIDGFGNEKLSKVLLDPIKEELSKANKNLKWIISMPILLQAEPFKITCGVLNIDGMNKKLFRDQLKLLLPDIAVAAALIGIVNQSSDILNGNCVRDYGSLAGGDDYKGRLQSDFLIKTNEVDPSECPEPSDEFKDQLGRLCVFWRM